jgi:hypothetical protein
VAVQDHLVVDIVEVVDTAVAVAEDRLAVAVEEDNLFSGVTIN